MNELIEKIIDEEWAQFQLVNNEGGRASCQDDRQQFDIMRGSQFSVWPEELLRSYYSDLLTADIEGRNLIFNKYAYMMERTDPEGYERIKHVLPEISPEQRAFMEPAVQLQVRWAEEFAREYPKFSGRGRIIRACDEYFGLTSVETYQRGELYSYGAGTQLLYCEFVFRCEQDGKNLAYLMREQMAKMYGYKSLDEIERSIQ